MDGLTRAVRADGAMLVFGGPYGNLEATTAALAYADRLRIPPERVVCTGDVAAYCADPAATIARVRSHGGHVVMGDCDQQLGFAAADLGCGFASSSAGDRLTQSWFKFADRALGEDDRAWLRSLPRRLEIEIAGMRLAVIHGGADDVSQLIFESTPALVKARALDRLGTHLDGVIAGHCGLPFSQIIDQRLWHNAGVVGVPANDGTTRVWVCVLEPARDGLLITHHAISYDHQAAAAKLLGAGLPETYALALRTGLWPSCDVLPKIEINARGVPYVPGRVFWQRPHRHGAPRRRRPLKAQQLWPAVTRDNRIPLAAGKFEDPLITAQGDERARVHLEHLNTLWFNTGTLCNITCRNCYIGSSPSNDRLVYLTPDDVVPYLDEIVDQGFPTTEIGFTGGEPFLNPNIVKLLELCLGRGYRTLVLTNAMRPMMRYKSQLLALRARYADRLSLRVSVDHFTALRHEEERGIDTFAKTMSGLRWLSQHGFDIAVAGRTMWGDDLGEEREGYRRLFEAENIAIDADDRSRLVLFPEMDARVDVPEITTQCWDILDKSPADMMCATSRMVVKRKAAGRPVVLSCTLMAYEPSFELGNTLREADRSVSLNHAHCARFCVLGGASCSPAPVDAPAADALATDQAVGLAKSVPAVGAERR